MLEQIFLNLPEIFSLSIYSEQYIEFGNPHSVGFSQMSGHFLNSYSSLYFKSFFPPGSLYHLLTLVTAELLSESGK